MKNRLQALKKKLGEQREHLDELEKHVYVTSSSYSVDDELTKQWPIDQEQGSAVIPMGYMNLCMMYHQPGLYAIDDIWMNDLVWSDLDCIELRTWTRILNLS